MWAEKPAALVLSEPEREYCTVRGVEINRRRPQEFLQPLYVP